MRPDQTDPEIKTTTARRLSSSTSDVASGEIRDDGMAAMPRRERAGSPDPAAIERTMSWQDIKSRFVDDPAAAMAAAEELVGRAVEQRMRALRAEADALTATANDEPSTEDMRTRLIRYQEYCERLPH